MWIVRHEKTSYFLWKYTKKKMSTAAVVISPLRVDFANVKNVSENTQEMPQYMS